MKICWYQFVGAFAGESFYMFLWTELNVDKDKLLEISKNIPTKKILKKIGVPKDLAKDCLNAVINVKDHTLQKAQTDNGPHEHQHNKPPAFEGA